MHEPDRLKALLAEIGAPADKLNDAQVILAPLSTLTPIHETCGGSDEAAPDWRQRRVLAVVLELTPSASAAQDDLPDVPNLSELWRAHADPLPEWDASARSDDAGAPGAPPPVDEEAAARLERMDALMADLRQELGTDTSHRLRGHVSFTGLRALLAHPGVLRCVPLPVFTPTQDTEPPRSE
jgi:hypothetical protein